MGRRTKSALRERATAPSAGDDDRMPDDFQKYLKLKAADEALEVILAEKNSRLMDLQLLIVKEPDSAEADMRMQQVQPTYTVHVCFHID